MWPRKNPLDFSGTAKM